MEAAGKGAADCCAGDQLLLLAHPQQGGENLRSPDGRSRGQASGSRKNKRSHVSAALLFALVSALAAAPLAAARAVEINFEGRPNQINLPFTVQYTWATPTKTVWPATLTYTATETGTSYFSITAVRTARVTSGSLQGALYLRRNSGDDSGGSDRALVANAPQVEIWQGSAGPAGAPPARVAAVTCTFDGGGATATLQTPGTNVRCAFTFNAPMAYDPEQPAELRVPSVTFQGYPASAGFPPFAIEPYGSGGAPGRCAVITDVMTFAAVNGKASPYEKTPPITAPYGGAATKPIASPTTEICESTVFRYTAVYPPTTCGTTWPVTNAVELRPRDGTGPLKTQVSMTVTPSCGFVASPPFPPPPSPPAPPPPPPPPAVVIVPPVVVPGPTPGGFIPGPNPAPLPGPGVAPALAPPPPPISLPSAPAPPPPPGAPAGGGGGTTGGGAPFPSSFFGSPPGVRAPLPPPLGPPPPPPPPALPRLRLQLKELKIAPDGAASATGYKWSVSITPDKPQVRTAFNSPAAVKYKVSYTRAPTGGRNGGGAAGSRGQLSGVASVANVGRGVARLVGDGVKLFAVIDGGSIAGNGFEQQIATLACVDSEGGRVAIGAFLSIPPDGGAVTCRFNGLIIPAGATRLFVRATTANGTFTSDQITTPRAAPPAAPPGSPGECAYVSDSFIDPPAPDQSGLASPRAISPRVAQGNGAGSALSGTSGFDGKAPDATDEGAALKLCSSATFEYTATFGPFPGTGCGTYTAANLAKARPIDGKGQAAQDDDNAPTDLGMVALAVEGCPRKGPVASLDAPSLAVVTEHAWDLEGAAAPVALVLKPGADTASAAVTLKAKRRMVGVSYELAGTVTLRNPTQTEWRLRDVRVEAVRPAEITAVLTQSASCPTSNDGSIVLPAAKSSSSPSTLTCRYTLAASTPEPGVLTAVALIAGESTEKEGGAATAPRGAAPRAAPSRPQAFSFVPGDGGGGGASTPRIGRRSVGECATLFGAFAAPTPLDAKKTGSLLRPNATGGNVPPATGLQLCQEERSVRITADFSGLSDRMCNMYKARYDAALVPQVGSNGKGGEEVLVETPLLLILAGCPAAKGRPRVALGALEPVNFTTYSWSAAASTGQGGPDAGAPPPPAGQDAAATQLLLAALTRQQQAQQRAAAAAEGGPGRALLDAAADTADAGGTIAGGSSTSDASGVADSPAAASGDEADDAAKPIPAAVGRAVTTPVRAVFSRKATTRQFRLGGDLKVAGSIPGGAGAADVLLAFDDGSFLRVPAKCPDSGGEDGSVKCKWQLPEPLSSPKGGRAFALLEGPSPAAMSGAAPFSFAKAKGESLGACARVSASWAIEGAAAGGGAPQPRAAADGGAGAAPGAGAPAEVCDSKTYSWNLQLGAFATRQCGANLVLAGAAAATPTSGAQQKQSGNTKAPVSLTGCPGRSGG